VLHVLVVEDNPGDVELVRKRLREARGTPVALAIAETLAEGLSIQRAQGSDVVLLDLNLPDAHGLETIDAFRAEFTDIPIVVLTGTADLDTAVEALRRGADDYIAKTDLSSDLLTRTVRYSLERRRMIVEARRAAHARENLLQVVSHDLRNQVNTIGLGLQITRNGVAPENMRRFEAIERATSTMRRLLEDLVDIAALEKGVLSIAPSLVDAHALFEEAKTMLAALVESKGLSLHWHSDEETIVWADRERILQVLGNLVGNAVKFTPAGGAIRVTASADVREMMVRVSDTGPGIREADQAHVFNRFFRGSRPSGHGAGLGLAIAQGLVHAHGGRIGVESAEGRGATFFFSLPREPPKIPAVDNRRDSPP
jgi:signal transduction histidine kinase